MTVIFRPSSSSRWLDCTASIDIISNFVDAPSKAAQEGTDAHTLAHFCLENDIHASKDILTNFEFETNGDFRNNFEIDEELRNNFEFEIDEEMITHINNSYIEYVHSVGDESSVHLYEAKLSLSKVIPNCGGTADAVVIDSVNRKVHVIDLKYGKFVKVDVKGNSQLQLYALGVYLDQRYEYAKDYTFVTHIFQPRMHNIAHEELSNDALSILSDRLKIAYKEFLTGGVFRPSISACYWCPFLECKHLHDYAMSGVNEVEHIDKMNINSIDDSEILEIFKKSKFLSRYISRVKSHVHKKLSSGIEIKGLKLGKGNMRRSWKPGEEVEKSIYNLVGDELYSKAPISVPKMEKLLGAKQFKELVSQYVDYTQGALKIIQSDEEDLVVDFDCI